MSSNKNFILLSLFLAESTSAVDIYTCRSVAVIISLGLNDYLYVATSTRERGDQEHKLHARLTQLLNKFLVPVGKCYQCWSTLLYRLLFFTLLSNCSNIPGTSTQDEELAMSSLWQDRVLALELLVTMHIFTTCVVSQLYSSFLSSKQHIRVAKHIYYIYICIHT